MIHYIDDETPNPTQVFDAWIADEHGTLVGRSTKPVAITTTDPTIPTTGRRRIDNQGRLWFPNASALEFRNDQTGPAAAHALRIYGGGNIEGAGLRFIHANRWHVVDQSIIHAPVGVEYVSEIPGGQNEHNVLSHVNIINCTRGIHARAESGAWRSMKGWHTTDVLVSGAAYPVQIDLDAYAAKQIELTVFDGRPPGSPGATFCWNGKIHGSRLLLVVEGTTPIALYLKGDPLQAQGSVEMHVVHPATVFAIYDGPAAEAPPAKFTYGQNAPAFKTWTTA